jgi:hypothetical protein
MTRRVLIVSPYFPPSTLAGVHRARHLAKHLPAAGWTPTVLCVHEDHHEQRLDPALARLLPQDLDLVKVGAWPARATRRFGVGEIGIRAYPHLAEGVRQLIETRDPDAVLITGSPFYPMLLARTIKRRYRKPVVLDFQDPWVSSWGARQPLSSKAGLSHALARRLEPIALRHADFVTSVSKRQNEEMAARYSWLAPERMAAVPIGGDPDDFLALGEAEDDAEVRLSSDDINLVYVGTLLPRADEVLRQVLRAAMAARQRCLAERLKLTFVGTSNQPNGEGDYRVLTVAHAEGVQDFVAETPQRVPFLAALGLLKQADCILLMGSDEPHYTASKVFPALLSGRPCVGVFHQASSAGDILRRAGVPVIAFSSLDDLAARRQELSKTIAHAVTAGPGSFHRDASVVDRFTAAAVGERFGEILARACPA